jgi:hypothetical protein
MLPVGAPYGRESTGELHKFKTHLSWAVVGFEPQHHLKVDP